MARGRRPGVPNKNFPSLPLERALELPRALHDGASGMPTDRLTLSQLLDKSPSSSFFMVLVLASRAYGLTTGGKNADEFALTAIGQLAVSDDAMTRTEGLRKAVLSVDPFRAFLTAYDKKKVPLAAAFRSFLVNQASVHPDHVEQCMAQLMDDVRLAGLVRNVKGSEWIDLQNTAPAPIVTVSATEGDLGSPDTTDERAPAVVDPLDDAGGAAPQTPPTVALPAVPPKVFITHGKNDAIVKQLQELLTFGQFDPIVAEEQQTAAKPVPDKVLEGMRACSAAVIHVATEQRLLDESGNEHRTINENVLIEIGAAMALYGRKFILLVPKGIQLPSNLQGLYRCDYEGDSLDYEATMKLLKAFNDFR